MADEKGGGLAGPIISGAAAVGGAIANIFASSKMNKKTMEYNREMYEKQKQDNLAMWNLQNSYNSPEQQMQRAQAAGVNPQGIFGNNSFQAATAPDTPHAMPYSPRVPQIDTPQIVDSYWNIKSRQQQLSNEKAVGDNMLMQNQLMKADLVNKNLANKFSLETYNSNLRGTYGKNEGAYNNAIQSYVNRELLQSLTGNDYSLGSKGTSSVGVDGTENMLKKNWMQNYYNNQKTGALRSGAIKRNDLDNDIKGIQKKYTERMMSGKFEDMSARDILQLLLQGGALFK